MFLVLSSFFIQVREAAILKKYIFLSGPATKSLVSLVKNKFQKKFFFLSGPDFPPPP